MDPEESQRAVGFQKNSSNPGSQGENYLLAIGINAYRHLEPLNNAVKDIRDFVTLMTGQFGFQDKPTHKFHLENEIATRGNILQTLKNLCKTVDENDRVLICYSGHGYLDPVTQLGYWLPVEAQLDHESGFISNSDVRDYIRAMKSRHTLLISDSCFSGSLLVRNAGNDGGSAFDEWESRRSRWLFCSGRGVVADGAPGLNSPFMDQILKVLQNPKYDKINIGRLADEVIRAVQFNYEQQAEASPFFGAGHDGGQFVFYRPDAAGQSKPQSPEIHKTESDKPPGRENLLPETVQVEGGTFNMGSAAFENEMPVHPVTVPSFFMGKYPVTFEEYDHFCEATGWKMPDDEGWGRADRPVINVSWEDAWAYCEWLSHETGQRYRLPSEAEWEFAARGGIHSKSFEFAGGNVMNLVGWFEKNSGEQTQPVGKKMANELGLFDMSGNIQEWCTDHWHESYHGAPADGSAWISDRDSGQRVLRGGAWYAVDQLCRVARRFKEKRFYKSIYVGFRVVRDAE